MQLEHLLGNERFKKALAPFFKENFPQSVILEGPPGTGKKTAAYDIARNLMCTGPQPPCGRCGACVRACPGKALEIRQGRAALEKNKCIKCYCCHELCPVKAIDL